MAKHFKGGDIINEGKKFEEDFKKSVPEGAYFLRIKDSAMSWGQGENIRFTPKNPYDAILFANNTLFVLELKSINGTSLPFDNIKNQQIQELLLASKCPGVKAGLIINFRKSETTYFFPIEDFNAFMLVTDKKSINKKDLQFMYAIEIQAHKKRTRSRYDIAGFIEQVTA